MRPTEIGTDTEMTQYITLTAAEFAAEYPRANGHGYDMYVVAVDANPRTGRDLPACHIPAGMAAVLVGYTNQSRSKSTFRWALVPAGEAE